MTQPHWSDSPHHHKQSKDATPDEGRSGMHEESYGHSRHVHRHAPGDHHDSGRAALPRFAIVDKAAVTQTAALHAGEQLWAKSASDVRLSLNGELGCAISVRIVYNEAGVGPFHSGNVGGLLREAKAKGWTTVDESSRRPGDMVIAYDPSTPHWQKGGGHSHVGIVGANGNIFNNSSRQNHTWASESIDVAFNRDKYSQRIVLRPPS